MPKEVELEKTVVEPETVVESEPVETEPIIETEPVIEPKITESVREDIGEEISLMRIEERMRRAIEELVHQGSNIEQLKNDIISRIDAGVDSMEIIAARLEEQSEKIKVPVDDEIDKKKSGPIEKSTRKYGLI